MGPLPLDERHHRARLSKDEKRLLRDAYIKAEIKRADDAAAFNELLAYMAGARIPVVFRKDDLKALRK